MMLILVGLLCLLTPFSLVFLFKDKKRAFLNIFLISTVYTTLTALLLQAAGIFNYSTVFFSYLVAIIFNVVYLKRKSALSLHYCKGMWMYIYGNLRKNIFIVGCFLIALTFLSSIHYFYNGVVDTYLGQTVVNNSSYGYPMYSDEWIAAALTQYSINNQTLPVFNPLDENKSFVNFFLFFHASLAQLILVLSLDPVSNYAIFSILSGLATCTAIFLVLRVFDVNSNLSAISALTAVFVSNSGNLPGLWYLLPYNASLVFLLLSIVGYKIKDMFMYGGFTILSLLFYPPMIVFLVPIFLAAQYTSIKKICKSSVGALLNRKISITVASLFLMMVGFLSLFYFFYNDRVDSFLKYVWSLILRKNLDGGVIRFGFLNVLPLFTVPFLFLGFWSILKNKISIVIYPIVVGVGFWFFYEYKVLVFIIESPRVVIITAVLLLIVMGFGLDMVYRKLKNVQIKYFDSYQVEGVRVSNEHPLNFIKVGVLVFFVIFSLFSSKFIIWNNFPLKVSVIGKGGVLNTYIFKPSPPVTRYLNQKDIDVFYGIRYQKFISPPWKGLVVGVATNNYPLDSKASTISNYALRYEVFKRSTCLEKAKLAEKFKVAFAYVETFNCENFVKVKDGDKNLALYKYFKFREVN